MIWIFDLDETLYDEKTFVLSGLNCVAQHLAEKSSYSESDLFGFMHDEFISNGRLRVFQQLKKHFADLEFELDKMIELFRSHVPQINLYNDASELLSSLSNLPIYLVTDGNRKPSGTK